MGRGCLSTCSITNESIAFFRTFKIKRRSTLWHQTKSIILLIFTSCETSEKYVENVNMHERLCVNKFITGWSELRRHMRFSPSLHITKNNSTHFNSLWAHSISRRNVPLQRKAKSCCDVCDWLLFAVYSSTLRWKTANCKTAKLFLSCTSWVQKHRSNESNRKCD